MQREQMKSSVCVKENSLSSTQCCGALLLAVILMQPFVWAGGFFEETAVHSVKIDKTFRFG